MIEITRLLLSPVNKRSLKHAFEVIHHWQMRIIAVYFEERIEIMK